MGPVNMTQEQYDQLIHTTIQNTIHMLELQGRILPASSSSTPIVPAVPGGAAFNSASDPLPTQTVPPVASVAAFPNPIDRSLPLNPTAPRGTIPLMHHLPKYGGKLTGLFALDWIDDMERIWRLYNISSDQMANLAKMCCEGYAKHWAGSLPKHQTFEEFCAAFRRQFGTHNYDQIYLEMINHKQDQLTIGEYSTNMLRYFQQLNLPPEQQKIHFIKNLNANVRDTVIGRAPKSVEEAMEAAVEYETIYRIMPSEDLNQKIHSVTKEVETLRTEVTRANQASWRVLDRNAAPADARPGPRPLRCPKCLEYGHLLRECNNAAKVPRLECCQRWGNHHVECPNRPQESNVLEVTQDDDEAENESLEILQLDTLLQEPASDSDGEDEDAYTSSDDSDVEAEQYAAEKRKGHPSHAYQGPRKHVRDELPRNREPVKPAVRNPLTDEQKAQRRAAREKNKAELTQRNQAAIAAILAPVSRQLTTHKDFKHFRTDLHRYVDQLFGHKSEKSASSGAGPYVPPPARDSARAPPPPNPPAESQQSNRPPPRSAVRPQNRTARESHLLQCSVDPSVIEPPFSLRTEIKGTIEKLHNKLICVDSGAMFSGISKSVCREAGLLNRIRKTSVQYKTSHGTVHPAEGKVRVKLVLGPLTIRTTMIVMPDTCSYNVLLANDVLGPLKGDTLRSKNELHLHYGGTVIRIPLVSHDEREELNSQAKETYCITDLTCALEGAWYGVADQPPDFELAADPKNGVGTG